MLIAIIFMVGITIAVAAIMLAPRMAGGRLVFDAQADRPCGFGYRMAWLAVRSRDTQRVVEALELVDPTPANWQTGIGVVYDRQHGDSRVFVSPPVNGWTFVVGLALPHPVGRGFIDKATPLLERLGREFVEVQYFFSYPLIDFHAWARLIDGKVVRAFAIGDEGMLWNTGRPTKEEKALGLRLFELRGVRGRKGDAGGEMILYPTEDHVMRLAARWSIDPTTLDAAQEEPGVGVSAFAPASWHAERRRKAA